MKVGLRDFFLIVETGASLRINSSSVKVCSGSVLLFPCITTLVELMLELQSATGVTVSLM